MPFLRSRALRPTLHAALAAGLAAGTLALPAAPATALTPAPVTTAADPTSWCRPVVPAAVDPEPLACWLSLTAPTGGQLPAGLAGLDLGDLPPGGHVDLDALAAELERYEVQALADADAAAADAPPATPTPGPTRLEPTPVAPTPVGSTVDELEHQCVVLEVPGSCTALIDLLEATSGPPDLSAFDEFEPIDPLVACGIGSGGSFLTEEQERCLGMDPITVEDDPTEYELIEFDVEASLALIRAAQERAQARIREVCGSRGGYTFDDFYEKDDFWIECHP